MSSSWGTVLVIGGTGRLGFFVIEALLKQPECQRIVSVNRFPKPENQHKGVEYLALDLGDTDALSKLLEDIQPQIIVNTAAPAHVNGLTPSSVFEKIVVEAQDNLIKIARQIGTSILISTTSANVASGYEHKNVDETAPLWLEDAQAFPYWIARAKAERRLLAADSPELQTLSLRLPLIIGEREYAFVPSMLKTLKEGNTGIQIGGGTKKLATVSVNDAAIAHVLAIRALLEPNSNVHGEAFYITGARALPFWTMAHIIWAAAGHKTSAKAPTIIPYFVAIMMATVVEWWTYIVSFGTREPALTRHVVKFMCNEFTYNPAKAKRLLKFVPSDDVDEQLVKSVLWTMGNAQAE